MIANALLILVSIAVAVLRINGVTSQAFQAGAHMLVAGLFVSAFAWPSATRIGLFLSLVGVELISFANQRMTHGPAQTGLVVAGGILLVAAGICAAWDLLLTAIGKAL